MPRVKLGYYNIPAEQRAKEQELREKFGGAMNLSDVGWYILGIKSRPEIQAWLADVPTLNITERKKRYPVEHVAAKWYRCMQATP